MRRIITIAVLVVAPALTSAPADAVDGPEPFIDGSVPIAKTDAIEPTFAAAGDSISALDEWSGDPLGIVVWPNDTRRHSLGPDQIGVYLCEWDGNTNLALATARLNNAITPFYSGLSDGAYEPVFVQRMTVQGASGFYSCGEAIMEEAAKHEHWSDDGAIGILDIDTNAGLGGPGLYCNNCVTLDQMKFPGNERWAVIGSDAVGALGEPAHLTTAAHEVGHTISFPHSYSGETENQYDNPIDYMSGNQRADFFGRADNPYSSLAFNRYRAGWVSTSDVVFYTGGVFETTLAPVGVAGTQMIVMPSDYQYSFVVLDARVTSSLDPIPASFEGVSAHYIEQWCKDTPQDPAEPCGGLTSRAYTYPPSPNSVDHVTPVGNYTFFDLDQGEDLLAQGTMLKVLDKTADGFQIRLIGFDDVADSVFLGDILWLAESGITKGCSDTSFCPTDYVTRGQMAAFLTRALGYTDSGEGDLFTDDDGSIFEVSIDRLATAGVTRGCNPPINDNFCPNSYVTREQMAAFLVRALDLVDQDPDIDFADDDGSIFEESIERLATAGITRGCNPPDNTSFCPHDRVTRQQMAAFLNRALG